MGGYTKLFQSIVHSTIWREPDHVRLVWVTMLALADANGTVEASVPGLADVSRVSLEQCVEALDRFQAPDQWSRSKEHGGRRIEPTQGGWRLLNHRRFRDLLSAEQKREKDAERKRVERASAKCPEPSANVQEVAHTEVAPKAEEDPPVIPPGDPPKKRARAKAELTSMPDDWKPTKSHEALAKEHGLNLELEATGFRGWAEGRKALSWNGTFTTRLTNSVKWRSERSGGRDPKPANTKRFEEEKFA